MDGAGQGAGVWKDARLVGSLHGGLTGLVVSSD